MAIEPTLAKLQSKTQRPKLVMFDLLGTPKDQKVQKLYDTDHYIPRDERIKETLAWLDRYLGPVR